MSTQNKAYLKERREGLKYEMAVFMGAMAEGQVSDAISEEVGQLWRTLESAMEDYNADLIMDNPQ